MPRLIDHLRAAGLSNRDARRAMQTGKVFYRGVPTADPAREVDSADVTIRQNAPRIRVGADPYIVFRDDHLVVVYKPSGMLSVPAPRRHGEPDVVGAVRAALGEAHVVHRLDEPTSGLMLVARTPAAQGGLKDLLFRHDVDREYLAIARGHFPVEPHIARSVLVRDRGDGLRGSGDASDPEGKTAVTHLSLVEHIGRSASLVRARLETGRTHQVRIHLAEMSHPVLGDKLYGGLAGRAAPRLALHAWRLGFGHPITGEALTFEAPLADDLERLKRELSQRQPRARANAGTRQRRRRRR